MGNKSIHTCYFSKKKMAKELSNELGVDKGFCYTILREYHWIYPRAKSYILSIRKLGYMVKLEESKNGWNEYEWVNQRY